MFRAARPAPVGWNLAKTAAQSAAMWAVFLWVLPQAIVSLEGRLGVAGFAFPGHAWAGAALLALASCGGIWSGWTLGRHGDGTPLPLDTTNRLVTTGPYRFVRNPMAVSGLAQGAGVGIWLGSYLVLAYVAAGMFAWNCLARPAEERFMLRQFGADYERYRARVRCWLPRWPTD